MCLNLFVKPQPPPNQKCATLSKLLKIVLAIQIVIVVLKFASQNFSASFEVFNCLILYYAFATFTVCPIIYYVLLTMFNLIYAVVILGTEFQNKRTANIFSSTDKPYNFYLVVTILSLIFYLYAIIVAFKCYKEFKALQY